MKRRFVKVSRKMRRMDCGDGGEGYGGFACEERKPMTLPFCPDHAMWRIGAIYYSQEE